MHTHPQTHEHLIKSTSIAYHSYVTMSAVRSWWYPTVPTYVHYLHREMMLPSCLDGGKTITFI
jgi:hypothetical protein